MTPKHLAPKAAAVGLLLAGAIALFAFYYSVGGGTLPFQSHGYTVHALIAEPQQVLKHADVRAAGIKVGTVRNIVNHGRLTEFDLEIDGTLKPIYRDATLLVRQKTLVGENYVEIVRGHPRAGAVPDGGTLPAARAKQSVPLDQILTSLDATTRQRVRRNLRALGTGFDGRGADVNQLLGDLPDTTADGSQLMGVLDDQKEQLASLVQQTGVVMQTIANRTSDVRTLVRSAKGTAVAVANRDDAVEASLVRFPSTLTQVRRSVSTLSGFSQRATPVVGNLRVALKSLNPVVHKLQPTAQSATRLFVELPALLQRADPLLDRVRRFSGSATTQIPSIDAILRQANPFLEYLRPYYRDVGGFFGNFGSPGSLVPDGFNYYADIIAGEQSFSNWTPELNKAAKFLLQEGLVSKVVHNVQNPFRGPGELPYADKPFTGKYPNIRAAGG